MSLPRFMSDRHFIADTEKKTKRIYGHILRRQIYIDSNNETTAFLTVQSYKDMDLSKPSNLIDIEVTGKIALFAKKELKTKDFIMADGYILQPNPTLFVDKHGDLLKMDSNDKDEENSFSFDF